MSLLRLRMGRKDHHHGHVRKVGLAGSEAMTQREAARRFNISRLRVRRMMAFPVPPGYRRKTGVRPKPDAFLGIIDGWLEGAIAGLRQAAPYDAGGGARPLRTTGAALMRRQPGQLLVQPDPPRSALAPRGGGTGPDRRAGAGAGACWLRRAARPTPWIPVANPCGRSSDTTPAGCGRGGREGVVPGMGAPIPSVLLRIMAGPGPGKLLLLSNA